MARTLLMTFASFVLALGAALAVIYCKGPGLQCSYVVQSTGTGAQGTVLNDRLDAAIVCAKNEYKERYADLKDVHDRFMVCVTILVTIVGLAIPFLSYLHNETMRKELQEEVEKYGTRLVELEKSKMQLLARQAKMSLDTMRFVWVDFLLLIKDKDVSGREIARPLYQAAEVLSLANQVGDVGFLNKCINEVDRVIEVYRLIVKKKGVDVDKFEAFVKRNKFLVNSFQFNDLAKTMGGKTAALESVLKFMNAFGIKMFGEVA